MGSYEAISLGNSFGCPENGSYFYFIHFFNCNFCSFISFWFKIMEWVHSVLSIFCFHFQMHPPAFPTCSGALLCCLPIWAAPTLLTKGSEPSVFLVGLPNGRHLQEISSGRRASWDSLASPLSPPTHTWLPCVSSALLLKMTAARWSLFHHFQKC